MINISTAVLFTLIGFISASPALNRDELLNQFEIESEKCRVEANATTGDLQDLLKRVPPSDMPAKCLRACLMKKYNVMDSEGKYVSLVALDAAHSLTYGDVEKMRLAQTVIGACDGIKVSENHCEAAAEYDSCFREKAKLMGLPQY